MAMPSNLYNNAYPLLGRPANLCNIDLLRGLATIAILVWHYQHFYPPMAGWTPDQQPMFVSLKWLYLKGEWAVKFFWILSGFIFFHVYSRQRAISAREFFGNRFSRLYPLHFVTLCLVAVLQIVSMNLFSHFQIYYENDMYHFILNLFFASHWGFQFGFSFNAPIWSISVEVLAYGVFFVYLKSVGVNLASCFVWLVCSLILYKIAPGSLSECVALFALGGLVHQTGEFVRTRWGALASAVCATGASIAIVGWLLGAESLSAAGAQWALFPALIWFAAALDGISISSGRIGVVFGHLTYASYLIHIPVQIIVILVLDGLVGSRSAVNSPFFLFGFVTTVLVLAWLTYSFIERPAQLFLRRRLAYPGEPKL
jgi:peptidoglycan/LPS O-acetylase OafA/YrhL